jgi:putative tryptophan/tyrosine transport system substrate-binding protein
MRRREFITLLGGLATLAPLPAKAQQGQKVYRVGQIATTSPVSELTGPEPTNPAVRAFVQGLRALGYVEGQNLIREHRSAEGRFERFGSLVAELVDLKADVIVTAGDPMTKVAIGITTTVPLVMAMSTNPVGEGLVESIARPGGNITGLTTQIGPEIEAKRLELLRAVLPGLSCVAYLGSHQDGDWEKPWGQSVRMAAQAVGLTLVLAEFFPHGYEDAFAQINRAQAEAVFVSPSAAAYANRALIAELASKARLPSIFYYRESVELGGFMSYGANLADVWRRAASYVDKILKGAKPADLPIEQPTKFELVINLKTAKTLGLTIPPSLLVAADEVIE